MKKNDLIIYWMRLLIIVKMRKLFSSVIGFIRELTRSEEQQKDGIYLSTGRMAHRIGYH